MDCYKNGDFAGKSEFKNSDSVGKRLDKNSDFGNSDSVGKRLDKNSDFG